MSEVKRIAMKTARLMIVLLVGTLLGACGRPGQLSLGSHLSAEYLLKDNGLCSLISQQLVVKEGRSLHFYRYQPVDKCQAADLLGTLSLDDSGQRSFAMQARNQKGDAIAQVFTIDPYTWTDGSEIVRVRVSVVDGTEGGE